MSGFTKFLTGVDNDEKSTVEQTEEISTSGQDVVGDFENKDAGDGGSAPLPIDAEVTEAAAQDEDEPVQVEADIPPHQIPTPSPTPVASSVETAAANDGWLRDQLEVMARQIEAQGSRLQTIEEVMAAADDTQRLLEEQETVIGDLTTRLRGAEECQMTNAIMDPIESGLIQIFTTVWKAEQTWKKQRPANIEEWTSNCLSTIGAELLAMLSRYGVEMIQDTTTVLSPGKQRAVGTQPARQIRDGEVISVVSPGFLKNGRVTHPEKVIVARTIKEV